MDEGLREQLRGARAGAHWDRLGVGQRTGVYVPLFSLRSQRQVGVGDAADLDALVDWCGDLGVDVIQLLPLNDMGMDSVPYGAVSAFALDPAYIALDRLEAVAEDLALRRRVDDAAAALATGDRIDWPRVRRVKEELLRTAWAATRGPGTLAALDGFRAENPWLESYLPYRVRKEQAGWRSWEAWGADETPAQALAALELESPDAIEFALWCQWVLSDQLRAARDHAASRGVLIKGDIPILVSRDSADVWAHRDLFHLDTSAGAPPDMYAEDGQNWGFPTYRWESHRGTNFRWWRDRLAVAERYYDLYRIDHVVGFFRIWTIPAGKNTGREGTFVPADEARWGSHGREILEMMLDASRMLPLAEDLGTIPAVCRETLSELGICGMKVQRWEKDWHGDRRFIDPATWASLSLATVSTHDSELLGEWWRTFPHERQELWERLGRAGWSPPELDPETHGAILRWVSGGSSLFVIYMLQELLAPLGLLPGDPATHRINIPGTVGDHNWTWRCPISLEELRSRADLRDPLRALFSLR
ncbi:MAG: 4-alpha-glucanotransferase [Pseudomonadota bacterium]